MGEKTEEMIRERSVQPEAAAGHLGMGDAERLQAEIELTRLEMSRTLDEIKAQISPLALRHRARERVKEASFGRARRMKNSVTGTIKDNPVPSAVVGLGAFWLARRGVKAAREREYEMEYEPEFRETPTFRAEEEEMMGRAEREAGGLEAAREHAARVREEMREKAERHRERAKEKATRYGRRARERASFQKEKLQDNFSRMLQERPLIVTTAAIALGAIIASLLPGTRKEHELMGESKEQFAEKLREKSQETFEKAKTVAKEAAERVKEEAKKEM